MDINQVNTQMLPRMGLPEEIAGILGQMIEDGEYALGDVLPSEQKLADMFKVSRSVVREALARLKYEGVITSKRGSGPIVCGLRNSVNLQQDLQEPSPQTVKGFIECRVILEGESAAYAALRRTEQELDAMYVCLEQLHRDIMAHKSGTKPDYQLHCLIAKASHNEFLEHMITSLSAKLWLGVHWARSRSNQDAGRTRVVFDEHRHMVEAIRLGDPVLARAQAHAHLTASAARQGIALEVLL